MGKDLTESSESSDRLEASHELQAKVDQLTGQLNGFNEQIKSIEHALDRKSEWGSAAKSTSSDTSRKCPFCHTEVGAASVCKGCGAEYRSGPFVGKAIGWAIMVSAVGFLFVGPASIGLGIVAGFMGLAFGSGKKWYRLSNSTFD